VLPIRGSELLTIEGTPFPPGQPTPYGRKAWLQSTPPRFEPLKTVSAMAERRRNEESSPIVIQKSTFDRKRDPPQAAASPNPKSASDPQKFEKVPNGERMALAKRPPRMR